MARPLATISACLLLSLAACGDGGPGDGDELPPAFHVDLGMGIGPCGDMSAVEFTGATSAEPRFTFVENPVGSPGDIYVCQPAAEASAGWSLTCQSLGNVATINITRSREGTFALLTSSSIQCDWTIVNVVEQ
jgi:hypothetical protein